jgi:hypothetical protein
MRSRMVLHSSGGLAAASGFQQPRKPESTGELERRGVPLSGQEMRRVEPARRAMEVLTTRLPYLGCLGGSAIPRLESLTWYDGI